MRFKTLAVCATIDVILTHVLTIGLALWGAGVWSFVLPNLLLSLIRPWVYGHLAGMVWWDMWLVSRWRSLLGAVKWTLPGRLSTALMHNGDYAILGLLASRSEVGIYYFAFALANQFIRTVSASLATTLMPAWVELNTDRSRRDASAVRSISVAMTALSPLVIAQAAVAEPAIALVYRGRWESAVLAFAILSLSLIFEPLRAIAQSLLAAEGRFRTMGIMQFLQAVVFLSWVAMGAWMGQHVGAAIAVAVFGLAVLPLWAWIALGRAVPVGAVLRAPCLALVAFVGPWWVVGRMNGESTVDLILQILVIASGGLIYLCFARLLFPEDLRAIRSRFAILRPRQPTSASG
jgi:PST family polysaccharide transporter